MPDREPSMQFANFTWPSRWNGPDQQVASFQSGSQVTLTTGLGVVRFSLEGRDAESIALSFEVAAKHIRELKEGYE